MHEYSLAYGLLEALVEHLRTHPVDGMVRTVHVRKGELVILSEEAIKEAWRILSEDTPLRGSELAFEVVRTRVRCRSCSYDGAAERLAPEEAWHMNIPSLACPSCGARVDIVEGKELAAVSLSVDELSECGPSPPTSDAPKGAPAREAGRPEAQGR